MSRERSLSGVGRRNPFVCAGGCLCAGSRVWAGDRTAGSCQRVAREQKCPSANVPP